MKLDPTTLSLIDQALEEDIRDGDVTSLYFVPEDAKSSGRIVSREDAVLAGVEVAEAVFKKVDPETEVKVVRGSGDSIKPGEVAMEISGSSRSILSAERVALNFLQRLSGVATLTRAFVDAAGDHKARILDTRKTTPGYRRLEKYAVACGGGANHRMGLYDAVMIKDNHLAFYRAWNKESKDAIVEGLQLARDWVEANKSTLPNGAQTVVQLEVDTLEQFERALPSKPDIVLLDNMTNEQLTTAVNRRDEAAPGVLLEASGGVNLDTIGGIAKTGVDRISIGALTHSAVNFDIGLDWEIT